MWSVDWIMKVEEVDRYLSINLIAAHGDWSDHNSQVVKNDQRRIGQGWSAFMLAGSTLLRDKNVPMRLKRKAFNKCIAPSLWHMAVRPGCLCNTQRVETTGHGTQSWRWKAISWLGVHLAKDRKMWESWIRKQSGARGYSSQPESARIWGIPGSGWGGGDWGHINCYKVVWGTRGQTISTRRRGRWTATAFQCLSNARIRCNHEESVPLRTAVWGLKMCSQKTCWKTKIKKKSVISLNKLLVYM